MTTERFDIEVRDKIQKSIVANLNAIATASKAASVGVGRLNVVVAGSAGVFGKVGKGAATATAATAGFVAVQNRAATSTSRVNRGFLPLIRNFRTIASIAAIIGATRGFVSSIDSFTELQNKLKNVTDGQDQLIDVTNKVAAAARRARAPILDMGKAFQRIDIAVSNLGGSQEESLQITETVSKLLTLQGATVNETRSALLQLSQAFNKGKLDGDEFRSVMELMPRAAIAIQEALGITRAELFEFAEEGKITSNVMRVAFNNISADVDRLFRNTTLTLGQALAVLGNSLTVSLGRFNEAIGFTRALGNAFISLADNLNTVALAVQGVSAALLVMVTPRILSGIASIATSLSALVISHPVIASLSALVGLLVFFRKEIKLGADGLTTLEDAAIGTFRFLSEEVKKAGTILKGVFSDIERVLGPTAANAIRAMGQAAKATANFFLQMGVAIGNTLSQVGVTGFFDLLVDAAKLAANSMIQIFAKAFNLVANLFTASIKNIIIDLTVAMHELGDALDFDGLRHAAGLLQRVGQNIKPIQISDADLEASLFQFGEAGKVAAVEFNKAFQRNILGEIGSAIKSFAEPLRDAISGVTRERILESGTAFERMALAIKDAAAALRELKNAGISPSDTLPEGVDFRSAVAEDARRQAEILTQVLPEAFGRVADAWRQAGSNIISTTRAVGSAMQSAFIQPLQSIRTQLGSIGQAVADGFLAVPQAIVSSAQSAVSNILIIFENVVTAIENAFRNMDTGIFSNLIAAAQSAGAAIAQALSAGAGAGTGTLATIPTQAAAASTALGGVGNAAGGLGDSFGLLEGTVNSVFSNLGNAISEFARTGEFDFKKLITSILEDMLRLLTNQLAKQFLGLITGGGSGGGGFGGGGGLFGGLFGGGGGLFGGLFGLFDQGGFTGNGKNKDIAGFVHRKEFVVNPRATKGNRAALENFNRTGRLPTSGGSNVAVGMNVTVINQSSAKMEVQRISETEVRIIAREESERTVVNRAGSVIAQEFNNANSNVSKSALRNLDTRRRR